MTQISKVPDHVVQCTQWEEQAREGSADYQMLSVFVQSHAENERLHGTALAYALWLGYKYWDACPVEVGIKYDFDYTKWAMAFSGKSEGVIPQYRRVGELFEDMRVGTVPVPGRVLLVDGRGDLILEHDVGDPDGLEEPVPTEVITDIYSPNVPMSKLLISRSKARSDDGLTDTDWGMIFNPTVTVEDYRQFLLQEDEGYGYSSDPNRFRCWLEGFCIMASENGKTEAVVDTHGVNLEALEAGSLVALKAFDKVARCLGLENPYSGDF